MMNMAAFAVIVARERETGLGDDIASVQGLGVQRPLLAWPMTIAMLGLAGIPATAGFIGKFYLIDAAVDGDYTWLGVVIVIGSMISLGYYLRVVAAMWMTDAPAPGAALRRRAARDRGRLARGRRPAHRARDVVRRAALRRRDALLRDRPLAAVRPRRRRRPLADPALLGEPPTRPGPA